MEISEIEFSLYLDEKILEFLPERNIHKRHKKYLGIKTPAAMLQIELIITQTMNHFLQSIGIAIVKCSIRSDSRTNLE